MNEDMKLLILVPTVIIGAVILLCMGGSYAASTFECHNLNRISGVETDVTLSLGCMVKYHGEWVAPSVMTYHKQEVTVK